MLIFGCWMALNRSLSARRAWIEISGVDTVSHQHLSLSARRAWIEILTLLTFLTSPPVALRKESVDRNEYIQAGTGILNVALRKESVDRNIFFLHDVSLDYVALRKESVDRNNGVPYSAAIRLVALRKESVDRNSYAMPSQEVFRRSLSARRAWIEMFFSRSLFAMFRVALRKESVDRNLAVWAIEHAYQRRSPQGERG